MLVNKNVALFGFEKEVPVQVPELKEHTYYIVDLTFGKMEPIHRSIMVTSSYDEGQLEVVFFNSNYDEPVYDFINHVYYINVVEELNMTVDLSNIYKVGKPIISKGPYKKKSTKSSAPTSNTQEEVVEESYTDEIPVSYVSEEYQVEFTEEEFCSDAAPVLAATADDIPRLSEGDI